MYSNEFAKRRDLRTVALKAEQSVRVRQSSPEPTPQPHPPTPLALPLKSDLPVESINASVSIRVNNLKAKRGSQPTITQRRRSLERLSSTRTFSLGQVWRDLRHFSFLQTSRYLFFACPLSLVSFCLSYSFLINNRSAVCCCCRRLHLCMNMSNLS
jgi:hypothetical protein